MLMYPPNGSAPMIVDSDEMIGGWFNFFMVNSSTIKMGYRHRSLGELFSKTFPSDPALPVGVNRMRASRTTGYYNYYQSGTNTVTARGQAGVRTLLGGFFGPAAPADTRSVKFFSGTASFSGLYATSDITNLTKQSFVGSTNIGCRASKRKVKQAISKVSRVRKLIRLP